MTVEGFDVQHSLGDRRSGERSGVRGARLDQRLLVERVAEQPLIARRQVGEPGIADVGDAAIALFVGGHDARWQAALAAVGEFDGAQRMASVDDGS